MDQNILLKKIIGVIGQFASKKDQLRIANLDTGIYEDLGIDSARSVDITLALEKEFNIEIEDRKIGGFYKLKDLVETVSEKLKK